MWKCPVCNKENESPVCPDCGFDFSTYVEAFPTLNLLPRSIPAVSGLHAAWEKELRSSFRCPQCGSRTFTLCPPELTVRCMECKTVRPVSDVFRIESVIPAAADGTAEMKEDAPQMSGDEMLSAAVEVFLETGYASVSMLQRRLKLGYARSAQIVDELEEKGIVGPFQGSKPRAILITREQWEARKSASQPDGEITPAPRGIRSVAVGSNHTVVLYEDGTVAAVGSNEFGQCNVTDWKNVSAIAAGESYTIGLDGEGRILAAGHDYYGQCGTNGLPDITALSAGKNHALYLQKNGTVMAFGQSNHGQCFTRFWNKITGVAAGEAHSLGLKDNGTVVAVGSNSSGQCWVDRWTDIKAIAAGTTHSVGLRKNGTVVTAGSNGRGECALSRWRNVASVAAGNQYTVGLLWDGSVIMSNGKGIPWRATVANNWTNMEALWAGPNHLVGLTRDGRLLAAGDNRYGQCDVNGLV